MAALLERGLYSFWISIPKILVLRVTTFYSMFICWFDGDLSSVIQKSHQEIGLGILRKNVSSMLLSGRTLHLRCSFVVKRTWSSSWTGWLTLSCTADRGQLTHYSKSIEIFFFQNKRGNKLCKEKKVGSLTFWPLKSCYPSATLPSTHLATIGPEMINTSHCGFSGRGFKNRRRRNVARMWPVWVSGYIYLYEKLEAPGHATVHATAGVPRSQGCQSLESRGIYFCLVL